MSESNDETRAVAAIGDFFAALEALDIPRFLSLWAEDGIQDMPFAPGSFPRQLLGKQAITRQYESLPREFVSMRFSVRRLLPMPAARIVVAEYDGQIVLKNGGRYDNGYIGVFEFDAGGKLARLTEYFDPVRLIEGFPGAAETALSDTTRVERIIGQLASAIDSRDWHRVRELFSPTVNVDDASVSGVPAARVAADDLMSSWRAALSTYEQTKHNFSDIQVTVTGDSAVARFDGQATHRHSDGARWHCGGDYVYELTRMSGGWRISTAKFLMAWECGVR